jgi:hypothetical protein
MHHRDPHSSGSGRLITQVEADSCCASSEPESSSQSGQRFAAAICNAVLGTGVVFPVTVSATGASGAERDVTPVPRAPVPRHVLLSVFLV